jgi:hypothetical protein
MGSSDGLEILLKKKSREIYFLSLVIKKNNSSSGEASVDSGKKLEPKPASLARCQQVTPQARNVVSKLPPRVMVRPAGFEPATYGFEVRNSIQLSYRRAIIKIWGERRGSNPRHLEPHSRTLPTELRPPLWVKFADGNLTQAKSLIYPPAFVKGKFWISKR